MIKLYETVVIIAIIMTADPNVSSLILGLPITLVGMALRLWTRGYAIEVGEISIHGPYRFVRHPHHLGTFLMLLGLCLTSRSFEILCGMLIGALLLFRHIFNQETQTLSRLGGVNYQDYYLRVPTLIPNLKPYSGALCRKKAFSLRRALLTGQPREFEGLVATIFVYLLMYGLTQVAQTTYWRIGLGVCALIYGMLNIGMMFRARPEASASRL